MAHILINNQVAPELSAFSDLETLISQIALSGQSDDRYIAEVKVNGGAVDLLMEHISERLSDTDTVSFKLLTSIELAFEVIESTHKYIECIIKKIDEVVVNCSKGDFNEVNSCFTEVIELIDIFTQLITKTIATFRQANLIERETQAEIHEIESQLLMILKGLLNAKELNNVSMLCDLLQYELIDNLTRWKIQIFSKIKSKHGQHL
ncbi:MAG: hypothetical protein A2X86_05440 [Bdellovibrionales bacterium GWA2_49_15]|nr:MAG: hypothetical protein A2X86_05440 [Bdellovibrionales bacterium GWA2_49_15]